MTSNELIKLNQIEQILNCLLALMQKQENTKKNILNPETDTWDSII